MLKNLSSMPLYIREPEQHVFEIEAAYTAMRSDMPKLRQLLNETSLALFLPSEKGEGGGGQPPSIAAMRVLTRRQAAYGILVALGVMLNRILCEFDPGDATLAADGEYIFDETMILAYEAARHRPLGSAYMPLCLTAAWASTTDLEKKAQALAMLQQYQEDFSEANWMKGGVLLARKFESLREKLGGKRRGGLEEVVVGTLQA